MGKDTKAARRQKAKHMIKEELGKHWPVWDFPSVANQLVTCDSSPKKDIIQ